MSEYERFRKELRDIEYSCSEFDSAISYIERARDINGDLREVARGLLEYVGEIESDYADREDEIKALNAQIIELKAEKEYLRSRLITERAKHGILDQA